MLDMQSGLAVLRRRAWTNRRPAMSPDAGWAPREHVRSRWPRPALHLLPVAMESEHVSDVASPRDPYAVFASALESGRLVPPPASGRRRTYAPAESPLSIDEMVSRGAEEPASSRRRRQPRTP